MLADQRKRARVRDFWSKYPSAEAQAPKRSVVAFEEVCHQADSREHFEHPVNEIQCLHFDHANFSLEGSMADQDQTHAFLAVHGRTARDGPWYEEMYRAKHYEQLAWMEVVQLAEVNSHGHIHEKLVNDLNFASSTHVCRSNFEQVTSMSECQGNEHLRRASAVGEADDCCSTTTTSAAAAASCDFRTSTHHHG